MDVAELLRPSGLVGPPLPLTVRPYRPAPTEELLRAALPQDPRTPEDTELRGEDGGGRLSAACNADAAPSARSCAGVAIGVIRALSSVDA